MRITCNQSIVVSFVSFVFVGISLNLVPQTTEWLWWTCFAMTALSSFAIVILLAVKMLYYLMRYDIDPPDRATLVARSYNKNQVVDNWHGMKK